MPSGQPARGLSLGLPSNDPPCARVLSGRPGVLESCALEPYGSLVPGIGHKIERQDENAEGGPESSKTEQQQQQPLGKPSLAQRLSRRQLPRLVAGFGSSRVQTRMQRMDSALQQAIPWSFIRSQATAAALARLSSPRGRVVWVWPPPSLGRPGLRGGWPESTALPIVKRREGFKLRILHHHLRRRAAWLLFPSSVWRHSRSLVNVGRGHRVESPDRVSPRPQPSNPLRGGRSPAALKPCKPSGFGRRTLHSRALPRPRRGMALR